MALAVILRNSTPSPVCNPVSTSVWVPFIVALTVPWEGDENADD